MKVVLEPEAFDEIESLRAAIAIDRPRVAASFVRALFRRLRILRRYPEAGRIVPEFGDANLRELILGNYRVWYRVAGKTVRILHLWDARRGTLPDRVEEPATEYVATAVA